MEEDICGVEKDIGGVLDCKATRNITAQRLTLEVDRERGLGKNLSEGKWG